MANAQKTRWQMSGEGYEFCNCYFGCGCNFGGVPNSADGSCQALVGHAVAKGRCGDVDLAGVKFALLALWPRAIHEGNGECLPVVEERADENQGEARAGDPVPLGWSGGHAHLCTMHMTPHGPGG